MREKKYKTTMLVNPLLHLSHALSSMHRECVYAWNKWKGKKKYFIVVAPMVV